MWYRQIPNKLNKKAGIIEKLKFQATGQLTDEDMITINQMINSAYSYDALPNLETIKNYFYKHVSNNTKTKSNNTINKTSKEIPVKMQHCICYRLQQFTEVEFYTVSA